MIPVLIGICPGLALIAYGALVLVASRLRWKWFVGQPQVRRTVKTGGQPRATYVYTAIGLSLLLLGLMIFLASLAHLNSA